ncbi:hypothetical protein ILUMI_13006 [Ignelater luminosus]|uniref:Uncharacterized protein n=1 Tax=Ignelater luminosus TaxID=2038154 RepID=A0A8K0CZB2_IGNLU|nr:hypothetical protein ILUMI_13006 [Ignelater luminosus]
MDYGEVQKANYSHKADMTKDEFKTKSEEFLISLIMTETKVSQIERATVGQKAIPLWFEQRTNRLTVSHFGEICPMRPTTSCAKTITKLLHVSFGGNKHTRWENDHENML